MKNKIEITAVEKNMVRELYNKLFGNGNKVTAAELNPKDVVTLGGIDWTVFKKDEQGNAYITTNESICDMSFGSNNDYRESKVQKYLDDCDLRRDIINEVGTDAFVRETIDLWALDGHRCYGTIGNQLLALLPFDLYRENMLNIPKTPWWWLSTPDSTPSGTGASCVRHVGSSGFVGYGHYGNEGGVRPFCILKSDILVSLGEADSQ